MQMQILMQTIASRYNVGQRLQLLRFGRLVRWQIATSLPVPLLDDVGQPLLDADYCLCHSKRQLSSSAARL